MFDQGIPSAGEWDALRAAAAGIADDDRSAERAGFSGCENYVDGATRSTGQRGWTVVAFEETCEVRSSDVDRSREGEGRTADVGELDILGRAFSTVFLRRKGQLSRREFRLGGRAYQLNHLRF